MDKSTVLLPELTETTDVYCGECRQKSKKLGGPGHSQFLGILERVGEAPVFWRLERISDRIELGTPLTLGIHPRGGYGALGDLLAESVAALGYPSEAMFRRDAERVAALTDEGVRAFDIWPDVLSPTIGLQRNPGFGVEVLVRLMQDPEIRAQIWSRPDGKPTRLAMTSLRYGVQADCRSGHGLRVTLKRLASLLVGPGRQHGELFVT